MPFWNTHSLAEKFADNIALIEPATGESMSYSQLHQKVQKVKQKLGGESSKRLIVIETSNDINTILYYLAALQLKHVIWLVDGTLSEEKKHFLYQQYRVNQLIKNATITELSTDNLALHKDLAVLMSTSGSTGSPKLVRLSYQNLTENCKSIVQFLPIEKTDITITTLGLNYSFGLSILNSHLFRGAAILVSADTIISREFWQQFTDYKVTSFYGVPLQYDILLKLQLARLDLQNVRYFALAGGKLSTDKIALVASFCELKNKLFYNMYGQTEATARISYLPAEKISVKPFSIGQAIPKGKLWLENKQGEEITTANETGELCYQGENVMLGMADSVDDLAFGKLVKTLKTGDLAYQDVDGDYCIVGRIKRFIKISGHRINLDEIEVFLAGEGIDAACIGVDDRLSCFIVDKTCGENKLDKCSAVQRLISSFLVMNCHYITIYSIEQIPKLSSGKIDYAALELQL